MSVSEYTQLMREAGLVSSAGISSGTSSNVDNKIQVEHVFIFDVSERWEKICKGAILGLLNLGRDLVGTLHIVAIAASISMVLWGCSNLVASLRSKSLPRYDKE
jgi:hypothetical protein